MFSLSANHFQPANQESLTIPDSSIRSLVVIVPKLKKSTFFLRKSARNCPPAKAVRSQKSVKTAKSVYVEKKDSSSKIFQYKSVSFFPFQLCPLTTEAMGLGGLRANFLSPQRQWKCGRKDCQKHISRPKRIGVC